MGTGHVDAGRAVQRLGMEGRATMVRMLRRRAEARRQDWAGHDAERSRVQS